MGVVAPIPVPQDIDTQIDEIFKKTLDGLQRRGIGYTGVLYAGLMIVDDTAYVLEFNCRFGDPETQVLMRLLDEDLYEICISTLQCTLSNTKIKSKQQMACGVVLASSDYPEASDMGTPITQIPSDSDVLQVFHSGTKGHGDHLVTNGGRVLTITAVANSLELARRAANDGAENTKFEGKRFRTDIGMKIDEGLSMTYGASGVSIAEGNAFIEDIKCLVARTLLPGMGQIGGFGALIDLNECGFSNDTQLVVGIDGVGTKLEIASSMGDFSAIGHDVVAMCVNDILCHCAKPIAFLDYFVCGKLDRKMAVQVVASIADACIEAGCSLVGGETAEMPGVYASRQWDVAGCAIGARCKSWPLLPDPSRITEGDIVLGLASNGIHSNGFSLARSILRVNKVTYFHPTPWDAKQSFGKELLKGTKIYVRKILPLLRKGLVKGCAHITGGGLVENVTRVFKKNSELAVSIDCSTWTPPHIFQWLAGNGPISTKEMLRTFNCGIGMVLIVAQSVINEVERQLFAADQDFHRIGTVTKKDTSSSVVFENEANLFNGELYRTSRRKIKVAILISGVGSNMKRLIERAQNADSNCEIVCVISNKSDAAGLHTAARMGIHTIVIPHTEDRVTGEQRMAKCLDEYGAELICLGGYMRILSEQFVQKYRQRIINIHPSLLPAFIGQHALRDALSFGAKVVGCTVHYVDEMVDHGAIIAQRAVPIEESDTYESLQAKIQREEHSVFPEAMITVAERILRSE